MECERPAGKALPRRNLTDFDIAFDDEITEIDGKLNFYIRADFDVDAVFGTHVETAGSGDWLNVYANYDIAAGEVCGTLDIELHRGGTEQELVYPLSAAEKDMLLLKMDGCCREQTGMTLAGYRAQLLSGGQNPSMEQRM